MHGIHSTSSTDLSKLRSNLARAKSNTANVVLISTGSFSPIHRCHLANLIRTKEYFENVCHFNVLAGFLSPSHDDYVEAKLGSAFLPSSVRIELCEKAIEEEKQQDWMSVDRAEALAPAGFVSLRDVTRSLKRFVNDQVPLAEPIRVLYVAGLDLFNRCGGMLGLRQRGLDGLVVVYRHGEKLDLIETILKNDSTKVAFIPFDERDRLQSHDVSSTLIRKRLLAKEDCSHLTYHSVLQHLQFRSLSP